MFRVYLRGYLGIPNENFFEQTANCCNTECSGTTPFRDEQGRQLLKSKKIEFINQCLLKCHNNVIKANSTRLEALDPEARF